MTRSASSSSTSVSSAEKRKESQEGPLHEEDVIEHDVEGQTTVKATWIHKTAFCVLGIADLFYWNCVLNILYDIRDKVYPDYPSMTDTLNAVNVLSTLIVAIYTVKTGAMNLKLTVFAGACLSVACFITAATVQWAPGIAGVVLLHVANAIAGACSGLYQTGGAGLASVVGDGNLSGYVSTGQGITGAATFALWQIISNTKLDVKGRLWTLMGIGMGLTMASAYNFYLMTIKPEIAQRAAEVRAALKHEATDPNAPSYAYIAQKMWIPMVAVFWNFFITLFFFPNIGPINWKDGDFTTYGIGAFQVGDLIGRYLPVLVPFTLLSLKTSAVISAFRTVFLPLAIVCWHLPTNGFWGNNAWHLILIAFLAITNGWIVSNLWMGTPGALPQKNWRSRAMNLVVVCTFTGISAGLWSARIFTAIAVKD